MLPRDHFFPLAERLARPPIELRHGLRDAPANGIEQRGQSIIPPCCEGANQRSQPSASGWQRGGRVQIELQHNWLPVDVLVACSGDGHDVDEVEASHDACRAAD
jgi:hypothetical protein